MTFERTHTVSVIDVNYYFWVIARLGVTVGKLRLELLDALYDALHLLVVPGCGSLHKIGRQRGAAEPGWAILIPQQNFRARITWPQGSLC